MSKFCLSFFVVVLFLFLFISKVYSFEYDTNRIRIIFYNVENLFDTYNDSLKDDDSFLPGGVMRWNYTRYKNKINSIYKTISAAGEWELPDIMAFCEIENRKVLMDLIYDTYMSKYKIGVIHEESPDLRGIDVCMLYRKDHVKVFGYRYMIPSKTKTVDYHTRSILYTKLLVQNDTLHLIVNHWPSRRGGVLAGEDLRILIAESVKDLCDSLLAVSSGRAKIVICGDFNSTPDDTEIRKIIYGEENATCFRNLSEVFIEKGEGTYRYRGIWEMIDQVIVSESLIETGSGLFTRQDLFKIYKPEFLLEKDPVYPGYSPFPTYRGYRYHGGFSDHLPVLLDLYAK